MLPTITTPAPHTAPNTSHHHTHKKNSSLRLSHKNSRILLKHHSFSQEQDLQDSDSSLKESESCESKMVLPSEEETKILSLFKGQGANWEQISKQMQGKSDLEVKRDFLQIFRRLIKNMNNKLKKSQLHQMHLGKLKSAVKWISSHIDEDESRPVSVQISKLIDLCLMNESSVESLQASIQSANTVLMLLKQLRKKARRTSKEMRQQDNQQKERGYQSDSSSAFEQPKGQTSQQQLRTVQNGYADEQEPQEDGPKGVVIEESEWGIKELLRQSGVLQVEQISKKGTQCQQSIPSSSQNLNNQSYQHFFEQSQLQRDCYWKKSLSQINQPN